MADSQLPWYNEGLRFSCTGCGQCCTGGPGAVWVTEEEIEAIAQLLQISKEDFGKRYLRLINGRLSLNENARNYDCVFLKENRCTIYPVRPKQCRTFPWWRANLESPEAWKRAAVHCEGISQEAPLVTLEEIAKARDDDGF